MITADPITLQKAINVFKIPYRSINKKDVKNVYRELCKKNHPDIGGGDILDMDFLKLCRNVLIEQCDFIGEKEFKERVKKVSSKDVFMTNKIICEECNGYGDVELVTSSRSDLNFCHDCGGYGRVSLPAIKCRFCSDGLFKLKSAKLIKCRVCKGTGIFKPRKIVTCKTCSGNGYYFSKTEINKTYHHCHKCKGFGFMKIDNPIFKEGTII